MADQQNNDNPEPEMFARLNAPVFMAGMLIVAAMAIVLLTVIFNVAVRNRVNKICIPNEQYECDTIDVQKKECVVYVRKGTP